ncbi:MAG: NAD(P)/FAD-dependent oxidoreductase [Atribacterota bacterium]|nr:NAD(P)/FAD-dependent oxidoreductase [Atribacterota bacterium]MDD4895622.1 NAD(P)/FAD-dependent oxidoreductase [Atribacterota bacterium]MDD5636711.1 NAD(P)/FAD-dependent oxidoreductase [Atribacterota bacterium]
MNPIRPLVIIGAGPAGIMAAITAANRGIKVLLLERKNHIGGKISVTGDGKGNLTNINLNLSHYHSCFSEFVLPALTGFDFSRTREFFEKLGLKFYIDHEGRAFPYSREAFIIQKLLAAELRRLKVEIITGVDIQEIRKIGSTFEIILKHSPSFYAHTIVLATGGFAAPQLCATGDGYRWAKKLGHHLEPQFPSLVQLTTNLVHGNFLNKLKLAEVMITLLVNNQVRASESGGLLFIPHGISGTAIFSLSRLASEALAQDKEVAIRINFMPDLTGEELKKYFSGKTKSDSQKPVILLLQGILPEKLSQFILRALNMEFDLAVGSISENKIQSIIDNIINFYLPITGTQSWKYAQVTCGGISVKEVNSKTMESKIVSNLYFAGEILDVDGDCGGYNLQWAWSSGYLAGKSAADKA